MRDLWDIQPFSDFRNPVPWLNKIIPSIEDLEIISLLGGKPTEQVFTVKNPDLYIIHPNPQNLHITNLNK